MVSLRLYDSLLLEIHQQLEFEMMAPRTLRHYIKLIQTRLSRYNFRFTSIITQRAIRLDRVTANNVGLHLETF